MLPVLAIVDDYWKSIISSDRDYEYCINKLAQIIAHCIPPKNAYCYP